MNFTYDKEELSLVMKLVSENAAREGVSPAKIIYKRSRWSPRAALEAVGFIVLTTGLMSWVLQTYDNGSLISSPEANRNFIIFGGIVIGVLGRMIYSMSKEQNFITAICKKYGYSLESLAESIPDTTAKGDNKSRMLLPMSAKMPANVDIYVIRNKEGIFVEEIHH